MRFRQRQYWHSHHPIYDARCGLLQVRHGNGKYLLEITIELEYTSREKEYDTIFEYCSFLLDMKNRGKGIEGNPYRLIASQPSQWSLPPNQKVKKTYIFKAEREGKPQLGNSTSCKLISAGGVRLKPLVELIYLKGFRREVDVCWDVGK